MLYDRTDARGTGSQEAKLASGSARHVQDEAIGVGAAVLNRHGYNIAVRPILHAQLGSTRKPLVRGHHLPRLVLRATGHGVPGIFVRVVESATLDNPVMGEDGLTRGYSRHETQHDTELRFDETPPRVGCLPATGTEPLEAPGPDGNEGFEKRQTRRRRVP